MPGGSNAAGDLRCVQVDAGCSLSGNFVVFRLTACSPAAAVTGFTADGLLQAQHPLWHSVAAASASLTLFGGIGNRHPIPGPCLLLF